MSKEKTKRRAAILSMGLLFFFVVTLLVGAILLFLFEQNANPSITNLNESFRAVETVFKVAGDSAIYPVTTPGRITVLGILVLSVAMLIGFAAQIFALVNSVILGGLFKKVEKDIDEDQDELIDELEKSQKLEEQIIKDQHKIIEYEEDIMAKLDALRDKK